MHIANPIYDVVFKFMMEDNKVAKAFLSAIIHEEVVELDFASQEHTIRIPHQETEVPKTEPTIFFTVCRFDFSAKIALADGGFKTVLIEVQKAKLASDIMRFRRYLGLHYQNPANTYASENNPKARQIYCIFLLGYDIGIADRPVIEVNYSAKDVTTNENLDTSNEFIQSLHHRSWIVQIIQLKQRRRSDLEKLLSIFDQENRTKNEHILNVNEDDFPEIYRPVIRRLRMAAESEEIQIEMEMEDDYLKELQDRERRAAEKIEKIEKMSAEKDKIIEEKNKIIEELKKQLAENKK